MKQNQIDQRNGVFFGAIILFISLAITKGAMTFIQGWLGPSATELEPALTGLAIFLLAFVGVLWVGYKLSLWRKGRSQSHDG